MYSQQFRYVFILFIISLFLLPAAGCGKKGRQRPADLPKLYRCIIHLTQDGKPVPDALISLRPVSGDNRWAVGGSTDETGKAEIYTELYFSGAPSGEFKVVVIKTEVIIPPTPAVLPEDELERAKILNRIEEETKEISLIPLTFSDVNTTTLKITVQEKATEESFELGKGK